MAGVPRQVLQHFAAIPLFAEVSRKGLRAIAAAADEVDVPAGRDVVSEGQSGEELYVLVSGAARVSRGGRNVATLGPGDFFGEMALLSRAPRAATVRTTEDSTLMVLTPRRFNVILEQEPSIARSVMEAMAQRIRDNERSISC